MLGMRVLALADSQTVSINVWEDQVQDLRIHYPTLVGPGSDTFPNNLAFPDPAAPTGANALWNSRSAVMHAHTRL